MCFVRSFAFTGFIALTIGIAPAVYARTTVNPGDGVDDFRLIDQKGESHELYYLSDMKAVVLFEEGAHCLQAIAAAKALEQLRSQYRSQHVEFMMLDSNADDTRAAASALLTKNRIDMPVLMDTAQLVEESLSIKNNGEALVIDTKNWKLIYRGAVAGDDRNYIAEALSAVLNHGTVKTPVTTAAGCAIGSAGKKTQSSTETISYSKTIAPLLMDKCVACHRPGGIGPWAMSNFEIVHGFAPMIREVVLTHRMPPWHADPHYGSFSNDRSLTDEQAKMLVHWIDAGAPRGEGSDPLLGQQKTWPEWPLGAPDLIVETPPFAVPATGMVPYRTVAIPNPLDHDVWIRAVDYLPGNRAVLHHVITTASSGDRFGAGRGGLNLGNYVPGAGPLVVPHESGIRLKKGSTLNFQMHYTTVGKPVASDVMKFGLYFRKDPPKFEDHAMVLVNLHLDIPPNTKSYEQSAEGTFYKDAMLYSIHPHAHFRGHSAKFVAYFPDGHSETLLNVPNYDFNWQTTYTLKSPKLLPAHTRVVYTMVWDNSAQNKANPDPNREVPFGEQSWDEMLYCLLRYRDLVAAPDSMHALAR